MKKPKISVVTCAYNIDKYIEECLRSVETQAFKNFEHIIVYGKSTDKTKDCIDAYISRNPDMNMQLVEIPAKGISDAMNAGVKAATGDYIVFLHADDWFYDNDALGYINILSEAHPKPIIVGPKTLQYGKLIFNLDILKHLNVKQILKAQNYWNFIPHSSTFVTKALFDKKGNFNEKYKIAMDYDFWFRTLNKSNFITYSKPTVVFRRHLGSTSFTIKNLRKMLSEVKSLHNKYVRGGRVGATDLAYGTPDKN